MIFVRLDGLLECPVCLEPFWDKSIYECKNGRHRVCGVCCRHLNGRCPSCDEPIGDRRCRLLEEIVAGALFPCAFCDRYLPPAEKLEHEAACAQGPCACPFPGCAYDGRHLRDHIPAAHPGAAVASFGARGSVALTLRSDEPFRVLLDEADPSRVYLLLNDDSALSLLCLGPPQAMEHTLVARDPRRAAGMLELSASGAVPCARRLTLPPDGGYLVVPDVYWTSTGDVSVSVSLRRLPGLVAPPRHVIID